MKRPLVPGFIQKLDKHLLLHHPDTWSARAHLVAWYALAFAVLVTALTWLVPMNHANPGHIETWITLLALLSFTGFVCWIIFVLRFNVFKRFGNLRRGDRIKMFFLLFVSTGLFVMLPFIPPVIETARANRAFGNDELVQDANRINIITSMLEYDSLPKSFDSTIYRVRDTLALVEQTTDNLVRDEEEMSDSLQWATNAVDVREKVRNSDSLQRRNDSTLVIYDAPDLLFVRPYNTEEHAGIKLLSSKQLYDRTQKGQRPAATPQLRQELDMLLKKYAPDYEETDIYVDLYTSDGRPLSHIERIKIRYGRRHNYCESGIERIARTKYRWSEQEVQIVVRIFFYITFVLSLVFFIFRHCTARTFFFSVLAAIIIFVFSAIMVVSARGEEKAAYILALAYFVLFTVLTLPIFGAQRRQLYNGIALNFFALMLPFIPLIGTALWLELIEPRYDMMRMYAEYTALKYRSLFIAEVCGMILFFVLLEPLIYRLYRRWYALPGE